MVQQQVQEIQQNTQQEVVPKELIEKFDNDEELIRQFLSQGYTKEELQGSEIIHPTKLDPLVRLSTGHVAGFWINHPNQQKWRDDDRTYTEFMREYELTYQS